MGWLRNLLVFPDDIWEVAAGELDAEFTKGKWLANSEIKLSHHDFSITLGVHFNTGSHSNTQYTKAIPDAQLRREIKLMLYPQMKGIMGSLTSGLLSTTGKGINLPLLGEDYQVIGDNPELAGELFGQPDFVSTLKGMSIKPTVAVGGRVSSWAKDQPEEDEEDVYVSVPKVVKDVRQLIAMIDLTKILLDQLEANGCLE